MGVFTQKIDSIILDEGIYAVTEKINADIAEDTDDLVYPSQVECALRLIRSFDDSVYPRCNHKIVEGLTQAGKTGVCKAAIEILKLYKLLPVLNINVVYYTSGDNAKDMISKNADLISRCFKDDFGCEFKALKNSTMRKDTTEEVLTNAIVFIDEAHYGVESEKNKLIQWLERKKLDMHNNNDLAPRSVFIVSNSATPFTEEMSDEAGTKQIIKLHVDEWDGTTNKPKYVGIKNFYQNNAFVEGIRRESIRHEIEDIRRHLDSIKERTGKEKVAIVRLSTTTLKRVGPELEKYFKVREFSQDTEINYEAMSSLMLEGPKNNLSGKPIMIVVKGAYTMGNVIKREPKKNIGAIYDVRSNCRGKNARKGIVSTIQGILGRITGYTDSDDWKDIRIWVHDDARVKMSKYYYEQASSTPIAGTRMMFVPDDNGEIGILPAEDSITYYGVPVFDKGTIKASVVEFLEGKDAKYKGMLKAFSRYTKKSHMTKPYFSVTDTKEIRTKENIGKPCYTFLYDEEEHTIEVLYGTIMRGRYDPIEENNVRVETLLTTPKPTFVPDPNGTEYDFIQWDVTEEYTNVPRFDGKTYKDDIVKYLESVDRKFKGCTCLGRRRNWEGHNTEDFKVPHISSRAAETGRYGNVLKDENVGKTYYNILYDLDQATIKVTYATLAKGRYETRYPQIQPVETLKTFKR